QIVLVVVLQVVAIFRLSVVELPLILIAIAALGVEVLIVLAYIGFVLCQVFVILPEVAPILTDVLFVVADITSILAKIAAVMPDVATVAVDVRLICGWGGGRGRAAAGRLRARSAAEYEQASQQARGRRLYFEFTHVSPRASSTSVELYASLKREGLRKVSEFLNECARPVVSQDLRAFLRLL